MVPIGYKKFLFNQRRRAAREALHGYLAAIVRIAAGDVPEVPRILGAADMAMLRALSASDELAPLQRGVPNFRGGQEPLTNPLTRPRK